MANTGPKFTKTEREEIKFKVAKLDRRGYTQWEIAKQLNISQSLVCKLLNKIRQDYSKATLLIHDEKVQSIIHRKLEAIKELWEAWDRSKEDKVRVEEVEYENSGEESYNSNSIKTIREGRLPEISYLRLVRDLLKDIAQITGVGVEQLAIDPKERIDFIEIAERLSKEDPFEVAVKQLPSPEKEEIKDEKSK